VSDAHAETRSVVVERDLPWPPEKIWRALTQPHLLEEWFMKNDFMPVAGHRFRFRAEPNPRWNGIVGCEVLIVEPNTTLAYSWGVSDDDTDGRKAWIVTWTLTPTRTGTHLRMEQSGFRPDQKQNYQGARFGWQKHFANLERHLARSV
jgi:uncharacterized protein YndB with AHSA1/START domain